MANIFETVTSFFHKIRRKSGFGSAAEPQINAYPKKIKTIDPSRETQLQTFSDPELRNFVTQEPERDLIRLMLHIKDQRLQLRMIEVLTQESTLQKITRSNLAKKVKRAAEKKLRTSDPKGIKNRILRVSQEMQAIDSFLREPQWGTAQDLLNRAFDLDLLPNSIPPQDSSTQLFINFQSLRNRLRAEFAEYEKTCLEMNKIYDRLNSPARLNKQALTDLDDRWKDLKRKYSFPDHFQILHQYEELFQKKSQQLQTPSKPHSKKKAPENQPDQEPVQQKSVMETQKNQEEVLRKKRLSSIDQLHEKVRSFKEKLGRREASHQLRHLQKELSKLSPWREEYLEKFDTTESLLKNLLIQHSETLNESLWDTWARTDRAIRIQEQLEPLIASLEADSEIENLLMSARGLGHQLNHASQEMKTLGRLDRQKDREIWEKFKTLTERGWAICDRLAEPLLEKFKTILSSHSSTPVEFMIPALSNPRAKIELRDSAFTDTIASQIKDLRIHWGEIGIRHAPTTQEFESAFVKLFEMYTRQLNLYLSQQQRLQSHQNQLNTEWLEGINQQFQKTPQLQTEVENLLEAIQEKAETKLTQASNRLDSFQKELQAIEKNLGRLRTMKQTATQTDESAQLAQAKLEQSLEKLRTTLEACKKALHSQVAKRAQERNAVLLKAEELALSSDLDSSTPLFEQLRGKWKSVGILGQTEDSLYDLYFENMSQFYSARHGNRNKTCSSEEVEKLLNLRKELLFSLEALTHFADTKNGISLSPLPLTEEEKTQAVNKILAFGLQYKQALSLDPKDGVFKETKKIMDQWSHASLVEEKLLPELWKCYRERVQALLQISLGSSC